MNAILGMALFSFFGEWALVILSLKQKKSLFSAIYTKQLMFIAQVSECRAKEMQHLCRQYLDMFFSVCVRVCSLKNGIIHALGSVERHKIVAHIWFCVDMCVHVCCTCDQRHFVTLRRFQ